MATVSIQVPMLETKLPVQTVANARCRKGRNGDTRFGWAGLVTRQGYPRPASPALGALLERGPEEIERLRGAAHPRAVLGEGLPRAEGPAARGVEDGDRPRRLEGAPLLHRGADGQVEEAVEIEVVQEEPAGDRLAEAVEVLGVALLDQDAPARAGGRPGQQVDDPGLDVGTDVLSGDADGQVPLADAVAVGRGHRRPEAVAALGRAGNARRPLEQQPLGGEPGRRAVEHAGRTGGRPPVDRLPGRPGDHVVTGRLVEVAGGHGEPEGVVVLRVALRGQGAVDQAAGRAAEDVDGAGVLDRANVLARRPDDQVGEVVVGQHAGGHRQPELVVRLGRAGRPVALPEGLAAGGGDAARPPQEDVDRAGEADAADPLTRRAHGQVEELVAVEVTLGHGGAEAVVQLGGAGDAAAALGEDIGAGLQPGGRAIEDVQGTGAGGAADPLAERADGQVGEVVPVEVDPRLLLGPGLLGLTRGRPGGRHQGHQGHQHDHDRSPHVHHLAAPKTAGRLLVRLLPVQVGSGGSTGEAWFAGSGERTVAAPGRNGYPACMGKLLDLTGLGDLPELRDPFLVVHLHGWTDAGLAGQTAAVFLRERWNATTLATFDADELIDFRARRPVVRLASGTIEEVTWSPTELLAATPGGERDALLLVGPEPDFRWRAFCDEVVEACRRLRVTEVFGLGAFPAPALHTDPVAVVGTSADPDLAARLETVAVIVELSAGIQTVLEDRLHQAGIPATGLWARVPPYLAGGTHPPGALALVETLGRLAGVEVENTEPEAASQDPLEQVEQAIRERPQIPEVLDQIRGMVEQGADERIPSGDEIAAELERFLGQNPPEDPR